MKTRSQFVLFLGRQFGGWLASNLVWCATYLTVAFLFATRTRLILSKDKRWKKLLQTITLLPTDEQSHVEQTTPAPAVSAKPGLTPMVVNLTDVELAALTCVARAHCTGRTDADAVNRVARMILLVSLARPNALSRLFNEHVRYRVSEGFENTAAGDEALLLNHIRARPQYRETMLRARLVNAE